MTNPLIVVYTPSPRVSALLTTQCAGTYRLMLGETHAETMELVCAHRPLGVLLDLSAADMRSPAVGHWVQELDAVVPPDHKALLIPQPVPADWSQLAESLSWTVIDSANDLSWLESLTAQEAMPAAVPERTTSEHASVDNDANPSNMAAAAHKDRADLRAGQIPVGDANPQPTDAVIAAAHSNTSSATSLAARDRGDHEHLPEVVIKKQADEPDSQAVLAGISRRFETNSPQLKAMLRDLETAARHNVTILLIGETGSGKTFLSKLIHEVSPRRNDPFLHVACGALPNELIESELFGHVKGSFTSAHADKEGKFLAAGRGTVLLDEIDVLGLEQQVKLLKVIETGEFEPVGSNKTLVSEARLVVASNLDLQPLVEQHKFRPDLYYRLNMLKFELPPLRERKADIMPLAKKFIQQQTTRHGVEIHRIERNLFDSLYSYPWPGNVRELENVIQRAVIFSRDGVLSADHLPSHIVSGLAGPTNDPSVQLGPSGPRQSEPDSLGDQIALTEKEIIEQALFNNSFSRTRTAQELGISRVTLYNKMKKYGMMK